MFFHLGESISNFLNAGRTDRGGSVGTTAASKLLGLAISVWDALPENSASLTCLSHTVLVISLGEPKKGMARLILSIEPAEH